MEIRDTALPDILYSVFIWLVFTLSAFSILFSYSPGGLYGNYDLSAKDAAGDTDDPHLDIVSFGIRDEYGDIVVWIEARSTVYMTVPDDYLAKNENENHVITDSVDDLVYHNSDTGDVFNIVSYSVSLKDDETGKYVDITYILRNTGLPGESTRVVVEASGSLLNYYIGEKAVSIEEYTVQGEKLTMKLPVKYLGTSPHKYSLTAHSVAVKGGNTEVEDYTEERHSTAGLAYYRIASIALFSGFIGLLLVGGFYILTKEMFFLRDVGKRFMNNITGKKEEKGTVYDTGRGYVYQPRRTRYRPMPGRKGPRYPMR